MKAAIAKEANYKRSGGAGFNCLQCRRVIKHGQAVLAQSRQNTSYGYSNYTVTDYWHRACIEGLLKKTETSTAEAEAYVPPVDKKAKLEADFNALREQIEKGESKLIV